MDQTAWPLDAKSHECKAEEYVHEGRVEVAARYYEQALRIRLESGDASLLHTAEALARTSNSACKDAVPKRELSTVLACINLTLGNLAALHMRGGKPNVALKYLKEAEALGAPPAEAAATQLSLCALLSQLGRHKEAEHHASEAVAFGEADILELSNSQSEGVTTALLQEKASALAVAYNNLAVQREYLGHDDCLPLYEKAMVLAEGHMAKNNPLLARLRESHRNALQISVGKSRRPSSAVNLRTAPRTEAHVRRPLSAMEPRRSASCARRTSLDQELLRLLHPEQQDVLAARHKIREEGEDGTEVPLSAPTLPRHMRVALEQQREGARCHQMKDDQTGQVVADEVLPGSASPGFARQDCATSESSSRRQSGDLRLQHALHFAGCEAARRIQKAYRRHRWFLKVMHEARDAHQARQAERSECELRWGQAQKCGMPRVQCHSSQPPRASLKEQACQAKASKTKPKPLQSAEMMEKDVAPPDVLPRVRHAMESGLPQRSLPNLGSGASNLGPRNQTGDKVARNSLGMTDFLAPQAALELQKRQQAAAKIQACWTCFRQLKRRNMAVWLQATLRCRLQQEEFVLHCRAAGFTQRSSSSHGALKEPESQQESQQVEVQPAHMVPEDVEVEEEETEKDAKKDEEELQKRQQAAAKIQACWTCFRQLKRRNMAVCTEPVELQQVEVQPAHVVPEDVEEETEKDAKKDEEELQKKQQAAAKIQACWTSFRQLKRRNMAVWLQATLRCRLQQEEFVLHCRAARSIQRSWSSHTILKAHGAESTEPVELQQVEVQPAHVVPEDVEEETEKDAKKDEEELQKKQQAAAKIQACWTCFRQLKRRNMAVWLQATLRCRLQQEEFVRHCHSSEPVLKAAALVVGSVDVDCISNGSRDTTASEEEHRVFKPKCDAWACARCGLVNEVSPDLCVLCEGPRPVRRSSLAHRAKPRRR
eukprot:Skav226663  [mRNA]  locus=scaffold861:15645:20263:+ [translate_table: standard]